MLFCPAFDYFLRFGLKYVSHYPVAKRRQSVFFLNMRDYINTYMKADIRTALYSLIFMGSLIKKGNTENSERNGSGHSQNLIIIIASWVRFD
jgi:hypothetical protein